MVLQPLLFWRLLTAFNRQCNVRALQQCRAFFVSLEVSMFVICRAESWELISCPQSLNEAWELADRLQAETGIEHWVSRA